MTNGFKVDLRTVLGYGDEDSDDYKESYWWLRDFELPLPPYVGLNIEFEDGDNSGEWIEITHLTVFIPSRRIQAVFELHGVEETDDWLLAHGFIEESQ